MRLAPLVRQTVTVPLCCQTRQERQHNGTRNSHWESSLTVEIRLLGHVYLSVQTHLLDRLLLEGNRLLHLEYHSWDSKITYCRLISGYFIMCTSHQTGAAKTAGVVQIQSD
jgi:hypothetical protein